MSRELDMEIRKLRKDNKELKERLSDLEDKIEKSVKKLKKVLHLKISKYILDVIEDLEGSPFK